MRGRRILLTAAAFFLGGEAFAATPGAGGDNAAEADIKGDFDLVSASLEATTHLAEPPYKYITNPVCLFGASGSQCDNFSEGRYLSLPFGQAVRHLPMTLRFAYDGAAESLTHLRLRVSGGGMSVLSDNLLSTLTLNQSVNERGRTEIAIPDFYIPPVRMEPFAGQVTLTLEITAKIADGGNTDAVPVTLGSAAAAAFTPTFSTNRMDPTNFRFSGRDDVVGYDFWATYDTIQWLRSRTNLWVNDFSALHSARYGAGRSILDHSTHHDGRTIDVRYASGFDDEGGLLLDNDCLSGAPCLRTDGILHMLSLAAEAPTEELNKLPERQEARTRAQEWIDANRRLLSEAAADAHVIYVGRGPIYDALVLGYNGGRRLLSAWAPGAPTYIREWLSRPTVVRPSANHDDHWHIALRSPPSPSN